MVFQILVLLLILGLILFLTFQGLYSALIMSVCCVLSLTVAFNFAEPLAGVLIGQMPEFAGAVALVVLFAVPLAVTRILADRFLPGMVHFPYWVDRAGGLTLGAVSALLIAGVLAISWRLLPFGMSVAGHQGLEGRLSDPTSLPTARPLWLRPDGFAVGLVKTLSAGSLSGKRSFSQVHPDYLLEIAGFGRVKPSSRRSSSDSALSSVRLRSPQGDRDVPATWSWLAAGSAFPRELSAEQAQREGLRLLKLTIRPVSLAGEPGIWLAGGQVQLIVRQTDGEGNVTPDGASRLLFPGWISVEEEKKPPRIEPFGADRVLHLAGEDAARKPACELFLAVPENFVPWFLTVKRHTRVEPVQLGSGQSRPAGSPAGPAGPEGGIAVSGDWPVVKWQRSPKGQLPVPHLSVKGPQTGAATSNVGNAQVELADKRLAKARLQGPHIAFIDNLGGWSVTEFAPPSGSKVVQLEADAKAGQLAVFWPKLLSAVVRAEDRQVPLAGLAVKTRGNQWLLFYDRDGEPGRFAGANLDELTQLGGEVEKVFFIMTVPSGAREADLDAGGGLTVRVDLSNPNP